MIRIRSVARWTAGCLGFAAGTYASVAAFQWTRYGRPSRSPRREPPDPLLDRFMPEYEVVERHSIRVQAPADVTFEAACDMDLSRSAIIRAIFRTREFILRAKRRESAEPRGIVELTKSLGWGILVEVPGREIVMGAVTQPWTKNVVFRALPPHEFARFCEPGYVKIIWTLRADPDGPGRSIHRTETRAVATDAAARARFRIYWAAFSPGIILIRRIGARMVKQQAQRRGNQSALYSPEGGSVCRTG